MYHVWLFSGRQNGEWGFSDPRASGVPHKADQKWLDSGCCDGTSTVHFGLPRIGCDLFSDSNCAVCD